MKIGIMQPYFLPYLGYFQLIANTDKWIFFDVVQFNKKSWMNRNRILHFSENNEYQYIGVPIKGHKRGSLIKNTLLNTNIDWKQKIMGQLTVYKFIKAKYYNDTIELLSCIFNHDFHSFISLSILSTQKICEYLGIDFKFETASKIYFDQSIIHGPGDWALSITKQLKGKTYINPPGGGNLFDETKYQQHGIELLFLKPDFRPYKQASRQNFIPGLSIVDILMFNSKQTIREMLFNDFTLLRKKQLAEENLTK